MAEEGVGAMPICGDDDRLKGMLTDRDIVVRAIARGKDVARTLVSELAEGKPVTIGADDSIRETLATMERAQVRRLPVIDGYRLVGIISAADIARHLSPRKSGKLLQEISKPRRRGAVSRLARVALVARPGGRRGVCPAHATVGTARGDPPEHRRQRAGPLGL